MILVVFRSRLKEGADLAALTKLTEEMAARVQTVPGFISMQDFQSADGEAVTIVEFETREAVAAWRDDPEHRRAQERGRQEFFAEYRIQTGEVDRDYRFTT